MGFSTRPEIQTLASLERALGDFGYLISQKTRVLDVIRAAAELPSAPTRGPSMMDVIVPSLVAAAGPVGPQHPWLRPGDWDYAFKSHFDFVVHAPLTDRHATQPLFAVEFDGPGHEDPSTHERDLRKNRLCLAAGLPLLRVDETFLHRRDHLNLIDWCASLWAAHRRDMPGLLATRDAEIADLDPALLDEAGFWLLGERPDLDVDLIFRLEHPYPPAQRLAERLARRYGFLWSEANAKPPKPQWKASPYKWPMPTLSGVLTETWRCWVAIREAAAPSERVHEVTGIVQVSTGYPLDDGPIDDSLATIAAGRMPYLPAGPWMGAANLIGEALCLHNTLVEVEHWLARQ